MTAWLTDLEMHSEVENTERVQRDGLTMYRVEFEDDMVGYSQLRDALPDSWELEGPDEGEVYVYDEHQSSTGGVRG
jgi:hypothetical protein